MGFKGTISLLCEQSLNQRIEVVQQGGGFFTAPAVVTAVGARIDGICTSKSKLPQSRLLGDLRDLGI
jgi:glycine/D-amino acid oxidase-like deaminating enzyme